MREAKAAIRRVLRARRRALSPEAVAAAAAAVVERLRVWPPYAAAGAVALYVATENEVPLDGLVADARRSGRRVLLPHQGAGGFVDWQPDEPLLPGRAGIPEPRAAGVVPLAPPALVLVPVVGWDATGCRLGRGGGFYDRVLAALDPGVVRVGVGYEFQEHGGLPREPWDVPVHFVVTERRVVACEAGRAVLRRAGSGKGGVSPTWVN